MGESGVIFIKEYCKDLSALATAVENSDDIIVVKDMNLRVVITNQSFARITGHESSDIMIGKTDAEIFGVSEDTEPIKSYMDDDRKAQKLKPGEFILREEPIETALGENRIFSIKKYPIFDKENKLIGTGNIATDVTDKVKAKDVLERERNLLRKSEEQFRSLTNDLPAMVCEYLPDSTLTYVNHAYCDYHEVTQEEMLGFQFLLFLPEDKREYEQKTYLSLTPERSLNVNTHYVFRNGEIRWQEWRDRAFFDENGKAVKYRAIGVDITERKKMEELLYLEKEQFKTTLLSVGDGVISTDENGDIMIMNKVAENLTGWTKEEAFGKPLQRVFNIVHEFTKKRCENPAKKVLQTGYVIESVNQTLLISRTGQETLIENSAAPIKDSNGQITGVVIVFRDFTEKREKQKQIEYLSFHDYLTGLYNRRYMEDAVKRLDTERNFPFTIMVLDVNGLKLTNDAFGHEMGDRLLKTVAEILTKVCRADDIIGRMGGDEFAIMLPKICEKKAETIKQRIIVAASNVKLDSVIVSLAIGYAIKTSKTQDIETIIIDADNHMYKNKLKHGKFMRNQTIDTVVRNINLKYDKEQIHTEMVSYYCEAIANAMNFNEKEIYYIKIAAVLHDIGKIMIPPELLNKKGKLTKEEFRIIKRHPETGYQILKSVDEYAAIAETVLYHHENWDGTGYPEGIKGESIPLNARIIAVADAYEAMTAMRSYQNTKNKEEAILELKKCAGTQFDPDIVKIFAEIMSY